MPKISIVLPTYNGSHYIKDSINSIIQQTETDWELIIINDCSTDETLSICEEFVKKDKRIKVFTNKENLKLPASLNAGFSKATGKYLTWTSDDNLYKPKAFEIMLKYLEEHPETDFVSADIDWVDENLQKFCQHSSFCKRETPLSLTYICNIGACFLYTKEIADKVGKYDESAFLAEDYDYWCRIALYGTMKYLKDVLYLYRTNPYSLSSQREEACKEAGNKIRNKYYNQLLEKYAKNSLQKTSCLYQISQKDKTFPITIAIRFYNVYIRIIRFALNLPLHFHPKRKEIRAKIIMKLTTV